MVRTLTEKAEGGASGCMDSALEGRERSQHKGDTTLTPFGHPSGAAYQEPSSQQ